MIVLKDVLPEDVKGGYANFGQHRVELKKLNNVNLTGIIPGKYLQNSSLRDEMKDLAASVCTSLYEQDIESYV